MGPFVVLRPFLGPGGGAFDDFFLFGFFLAALIGSMKKEPRSRVVINISGILIVRDDKSLRKRNAVNRNSNKIGDKGRTEQSSTNYTIKFRFIKSGKIRHYRYHGSGDHSRPP